MKPIEKYQMKFIELLKEAEEELGGALTVTVRDRVSRGYELTDADRDLILNMIP